MTNDEEDRGYGGDEGERGRLLLENEVLKDKVARFEAEKTALNILLGTREKSIGNAAARIRKLEAEVERLRAENAEHIKERSRAVTDRDFFAAQYAKLETENAALREFKPTEPTYGLQYQTPTGIKSAWKINQEVEALRAENAELQALKMSGLKALAEQKCADCLQRVEQEGVENDGLRSRVARLEAENSGLHELVQRLRLSEFRIAGMSQGFETERDKLRATLEWFEKYRTVASVITARYNLGDTGRGSMDVEEAIEELQNWEKANPEPSDGT